MSKIEEYFSTSEKGVDHTIVLTTAAFVVHAFGFIWSVVHGAAMDISTYATNAMYIAGGGGIAKGARDLLASMVKPSAQETPQQ